jgi:hypothetical protein
MRKDLNLAVPDIRGQINVVAVTFGIFKKIGFRYNYFGEMDLTLLNESVPQSQRKKLNNNIGIKQEALESLHDSMSPAEDTPLPSAC